ncbi:hypothetical protein CYMTET_29073 [Cymbomonas tetramitiformis]|uniref:Uncharacterized protein n=1 Tax=Cymbomonas tetramitiformis TaxID=36881 RepID=A0AAE0FLN9_9CHLO|nr:hypothetical protein CYMTET_29073 [Cymbomonas tetramitiformis]
MVNTKSKAATSEAEAAYPAARQAFGEPTPDDKLEMGALTVAVSQQQAQINELMELVRGVVKTGVTVPNSDGATSSPNLAITSKTLEGSDAPSPSLSSMLKGIPADRYFAGLDPESETLWLEFKARVAPSCRHPSMENLLVETREIHDIKGIVRAYGSFADGCAAWKQLAKLRRNTNYAYLNRRVKELLSYSAQFSSLTPPLHLFLKVKETFTRVREYVCVAPPLDTGHKMCVDTLEAIVVSVILFSLHSDYVYVKSKFQSDRLPRLRVLEDEVCAHYDNIIAPGVASGDVGAGIAEDRKKQNATKKARLCRKVECSTCHQWGHDAKDCFITNAEARESFLKRRPDAKESIMQKVQEYEKHGKLPDTDKAGAVADSELHPGLDGEDILFAISEVASPSSSEPTSSDFSVVPLSEFIEVSGGTPRVSADRRQSILEVPTSNYYEVLEAPEDAGDCMLRPTCYRGSRLVADCFYRWRKTASKARFASLRRASRKRYRVQDPRRLKRSTVAPVYDSFVYMDTICSFFPEPARLAATQSLWETQRDRCLGGHWRISPRLPWYSPAVQSSHTYVMSHVSSVLEYAEMACGARDTFRAGGGSGKSAVLDSGATRHIFNDMSVFDRDYDPMGGSTFSVVQNRPISSAGSGTVHFAKTDVASGKVIGLQ